jgi:hypothetical protein
MHDFAARPAGTATIEISTRGSGTTSRMITVVRVGGSTGKNSR